MIKVDNRGYKYRLNWIVWNWSLLSKLNKLIKKKYQY